MQPPLSSHISLSPHPCYHSAAAESQCKAGQGGRGQGRAGQGRVSSREIVSHGSSRASTRARASQRQRAPVLTNMHLDLVSGRTDLPSSLSLSLSPRSLLATHASCGIIQKPKKKAKKKKRENKFIVAFAASARAPHQKKWAIAIATVTVMALHPLPLPSPSSPLSSSCCRLWLCQRSRA